jgi:uncharacterized protein involved in exopolysaccharide biosynthesis
MEDIKLSDFVKYFDDNKKLYSRLFVLGLFLCVTITYFINPRYESSTMFIPQSSSSVMGALDYTSESLGLNLGSMDGSSPILNMRTYPIILKSHSFLDKILNQQFESKKYGEESLKNIIQKYGRITSENYLEVEYEVYELITKDLMNIKTDNINNSVTINLSFYEKELSAKILSQLLENLKDFQNDLLQKKAKDKSKYLEYTLAIKKEQLEKEETVLQKFLELNNNPSSPALSVERERIERNLRSAENTYILLASQLEMSKIEEIENLDRIHVISTPSEPFENHYPSYIINIILFVLFFLLLLSLISLVNIRIFYKN